MTLENLESATNNVFVPEGLPKTKEELKEFLRECDKPLTINEVIEIIGSTIKRDDINKAITFLAMLLTYTEEDQINLGFLAESSSGKSYIPLELSQYFPREDVLKLGYASPTSFFHDYGEIIEDPITRVKVAHINLERKILIFLDQPHSDLLRRLRSLLSHDEKQITLKITDKREKSGLRTKTVIIKGYPTVIFCSANFNLDDQEKTRLLLLSPEISQEKLRESLLLKILKESDREAFQRLIQDDPKRKMLKLRVWSIKRANIRQVKIPEDLQARIYDQFLEDHRVLLPRHQRDIGRLLCLIKAHALLNYMHREQVKNDDGSLTIIANVEDCAEGYRLYMEVAEANELGLSPELYNIYVNVKQHIPEEGVTVSDFQKIFFKVFHRPITTKRAREILDLLASMGLLSEGTDPNDKRKKLYQLSEINTPQGWGTEKNTPQGWGTEGLPSESLKINTLQGWGKEELHSETMKINTPEGWGKNETNITGYPTPKEYLSFNGSPEEVHNEINAPQGWGNQTEASEGSVYPTPQEYLSVDPEGEKNTLRGWGSEASPKLESEINTPRGWGIGASACREGYPTPEEYLSVKPQEERSSPHPQGVFFSTSSDGDASKINPPNPPAIDGLPHPQGVFISTIEGKAVVALHRITRSLYPTEKCCLCGSQDVDYQADLTDGSWRLLCYNCGGRLMKQFNEV